MTALRQTVSSRLRQSRQRLGLKQIQLADRLGMKCSAISHFESGRRMPSLPNLIILTRALGVSCDFILGR